MQSFHDVQFPAAIGFGATGGPERRVEIVSLTSGREQRNLRQAHALRRYDAGTGLRSVADIEEVLAFFEARRGPFHAFRFRDPFDWKSCPVANPHAATDQVITANESETDVFALTKTYGMGIDAYVRPVFCVTPSSLLVKVDGIPVPAFHYALIRNGSAIRFNPGFVPSTAGAVTAGFQFDVPVRFDTASLTLSLSGFKAGQIQSIPMKEVIL
jgi:uncharacterized protein (TIGR02217 family)